MAFFKVTNLALAAFTAFLDPAAHAAYTVEASTDLLANHFNGPQAASCTQTSFTSAGVSCGYSAVEDTGDGSYIVTDSALASVNSSGLHLSSYSYLLVDSTKYGIASATRADATATFNDVLRFHGSPQQGGYVNVTLEADGSSGFTPGGYASFQSILTVGNASCTLIDPNTCIASFRVSDFGSFADLSASASVHTGASDLPNPDGTCCIISGGSGFANYGETTFIAGISFTDLNGNPVRVDYTTDSGNTYSALSVPEPETYFLLLMGLIIVGARVRGTRSGW